MASFDAFSIIYDPERGVAVILKEGMPLPHVIYPLRNVKKDAAEVAQFCIQCYRFGAVQPPASLSEMSIEHYSRELARSHTECVDLLTSAFQLAKAFPQNIGPEEAYLLAAARGLLIPFDLAAKAIVDESSCGGLLPGWSANDAFAAFMDALSVNHWQIPEALNQARTEYRTTVE